MRQTDLREETDRQAEKRFAKMRAKQKNSLPPSEFGEPELRKYQMPDRGHAANAKARATQQLKIREHFSFRGWPRSRRRLTRSLNESDISPIEDRITSRHLALDKDLAAKLVQGTGLGHNRHRLALTGLPCHTTVHAGSHTAD